MKREEIRLVAAIIAGSQECRAWIAEVAALNVAHEQALNWGVDNTPASTPERDSIVEFATQWCSTAPNRVPANVLDRIENLVRYYHQHDYDPTAAKPNNEVTDPPSSGA